MNRPPPTPRAAVATRTILALATLASVAGLAHLGMEYGGPVFSLFWMDLERSEGFAEAVVAAGSIGAILGACALFARRVAWAGALLVVAWILLDCIAHMVQRPPFGALAPFARATRLCAPIAAALLWTGVRPATSLLRGAAAATFVAHGLEAAWAAPAFVDYLVIAGRDLLGLELEIETIHTLLHAIALADVLVALLVLIPCDRRITRAAALYMTVWGAVTAGSRLVHSGLPAWDEFVLRAPNAAVPLAIFLLLGGKTPLR